MTHDDGIPATTVTVDMAVFTVRDGRFGILLVRRGNPPFKGKLALPGGFLEPDEDLDDAAARELAEETALSAADVHLEQFRGYGAVGRDPRTRVVTICYLALVPSPPAVVAGGDAADAVWVAVDDILADPSMMAFDHARIVRDAAAHARGKLEHTTIAAAFCPKEFTLSDLRRVYEIVWGEALDPRNFHRKIMKVDDFLLPTGTATTRDGGRPAALYRAGAATQLRPPLYRR
ncbi:MAG TPA: NUDIX domain-containing protein [Stackebrandtia sp.]|nr:NUDIX domain-containing protein [Stackebrandtia sp.]HZE39876.1 NUDIX domain-containing protein [Stackebrandtia sp.]